VVAAASAAIDLVNHAPEDMLPYFHSFMSALPSAAQQVMGLISSCPRLVRANKGLFEKSALVV
jgi:hypothetical protein